jgi:hypothetical protein
MHICATLITGNAHDLVPDAIRSVLQLVDSVLLVDTGITDDTIDVSKEVAGDIAIQMPGDQREVSEI